VDVVAGPLRQPGAHLGVFVGGVVVDDEVHVEFFRNGCVQTTQEREKFLVPMAGLAFGKDRAGGESTHSTSAWSGGFR